METPCCSFPVLECRVGIDIHSSTLGRIPTWSPYHIEEGLSLKQEAMAALMTPGLKGEVEEFSAPAGVAVTVQGSREPASKEPCSLSA